MSQLPGAVATITLITMIILAAGCASVDQGLRPQSAPAARVSQDVISLADSPDAFRDWFNAARNRPRFVAILSSTCAACVAGAVAVKETMLGVPAEGGIDVGIVWVDILGSDDAASAIRASTLFGDSSVAQFHDPGGLVGQSIADRLLKHAPAWDIYLFFDADSAWLDAPPRPSQWFHQLGPQIADVSRQRSGDALAAALHAETVALGAATAADSPPTSRQLDAAKRLANAAISDAGVAQGPDALDRQCSRCAARGQIGQCSLAGWRHLIAVKPDARDRNKVLMAGGPTRPVLGDEPEATGRVVVLSVSGMACPDCSLMVVFGMLSLEPVQRVEVDFDAGRAMATVDPPDAVTDEQLIAAVTAQGFEAKVVR
jgi:copper chaperone CopZ